VYHRHSYVYIHGLTTTADSDLTQVAQQMLRACREKQLLPSSTLSIIGFEEKKPELFAMLKLTASSGLHYIPRHGYSQNLQPRRPLQTANQERTV